MSAMDSAKMDTAGFTAKEILPLLSKPCNFISDTDSYATIQVIRQLY